MRSAYRPLGSAFILGSLFVALGVAETPRIQIKGADHQQSVAVRPSPHHFVGPRAPSATTPGSFIASRRTASLEVVKAKFDNNLPTPEDPLDVSGVLSDPGEYIYAHYYADTTSDRSFQQQPFSVRTTGFRGSFQGEYGVTGGARNDIRYEVTGGARNDIHFDVTGGARNGIQYGVTGDVRNGIEYGVTGGARNDIRYGN